MEELKDKYLLAEPEDTATPIENNPPVSKDIETTQLEEIESFIDDIYTLRKEGLSEEGEYSIKNLVFKEIRNKGYLDNLKDLKNQLIGKELSLESLQEAIEYKPLSNITQFKKDANEVLGGYGKGNLSDHKEILDNGKLIGYIGFSEYKGEEDDNFDKALGIGDFMILERGKGYGTKVIEDLVKKYKNTYDLIFCFVDANNTGAIKLYKKLGKVYDEDGPNVNNQYYVTFYDKPESEKTESLQEAGVATEELAKQEYNKLVKKINSLIEIQDDLSDQWDRADNNPGEQVSIGAELDEISKKIETLENEKTQLIKDWDYCLDLDENLDTQTRYKYRDEMWHIAHNQPIIQDNGLFYIYQVREDDLNGIIIRLRNLPYVEWVQSSAGAFDFSHVNPIAGLQKRYHTVYGKIKEN